MTPVLARGNWRQWGVSATAVPPPKREENRANAVWKLSRDDHFAAVLLLMQQFCSMRRGALVVQSSGWRDRDQGNRVLPELARISNPSG